MTSRGDSGYILASALAVLLAISLVAAALVSTSVDGLRRVRRAEADATRESALRSALLLVGSQLSLDPRRRALQFEASRATADILGHSVDVILGWEHTKIDVNRAAPETVEEALREAGIDSRHRSEIGSAIQKFRNETKPVRLLEDVLPAQADLSCLHSILTVFGGQTDYAPTEGPVQEIGRPAAGSRLSIDLRLADAPAQGFTAVVLMTGDPSSPARVLDWRRTARGEACDED